MRRCFSPDSPWPKLLAALLLLLLLTQRAPAQQVGARWKGGQIISNVGPTPPSAENISELLADPAGNLYACGSYQGTADFGNGHVLLSLNNTLDAFLAKYDSQGACQWVLTANGTGSEGFGGGSLAFFPNGDLSLAGGYTLDAVVDGEVLPTSVEGGNFLLRITPQGNSRVIRNYLDPVPLAGTLSIGRVVPDGRGGYFIDSFGFGSFLYDTIQISTGSQDAALIAHADSTGHVQWVQLFGFTARDGIKLLGLAPDGQGGAYVSGYFSNGPIQIDGQTIGQRNTYGVFLGRITASGHWRWITASQSRSVAGGEIVGTYADGVLLLAARGGGNLRFTGSTLTSPILTATSVGHVVRFDSAGQVQWFSQYRGGAGLRWGTTDPQGNAYLVGFGWGDIIVPPLDTLHIDRGAGGQLGGTFLLKLDGATGQPQWGLTDDGGAQGWTWPSGAIAYAGPAGIVVGGTAYGSPRFGPFSLPTADGQDPFLARAEEYLLGLPDPAAPSPATLGLHLWPNPATDAVQLRYFALTASSATMRVYRVTGEVVTQWQVPTPQTGWQQTTWRPRANLAAGVYRLEVEQGAYRQSTRVVIQP